MRPRSTIQAAFWCGIWAGSTESGLPAHVGGLCGAHGVCAPAAPLAQLYCWLQDPGKHPQPQPPVLIHKMEGTRLPVRVREEQIR